MLYFNFIKSHYGWYTKKIIGTGIVDTIQNQKSISEEAALPHDTPSSTGSRIVSWVPDGALELWAEEGEVEEELVVGVEEVLETPNWNGASDIWILLGV